MTNHRVSRRQALFGIGAAATAVACGRSPDDTKDEGEGAEADAGEPGMTSPSTPGAADAGAANGDAASDAAAEAEAGASAGDFPWVEHSYATEVSAHPRHTGPGMDSTGGARGSSTPALLFVDSNATGSTGSYDAVRRVGYGTAEWCLKFTNATATSKMIVDAASGTLKADKSITATVQAGLTWWGQFVPGLGKLLRNTRFVVAASNTHWWHLRSHVGGIEEGGIDGGNRDGMVIGSTSAQISNTLVTNCEFAHSMDELFDGFTIDSLWTIQYCAFLEPLHVAGHPTYPAGTDHGFGPILGGSVTGPADRGLFRRNFIAHTNLRNPLSRTINFNMEENCDYNHGPADGATGTGSGLQVGTNDAVDSAMTINARNNFWLRGPNGKDNGSWMGKSGGDLPAGTKVHASGNGQIGWPNVASQKALMTHGLDAYFSPTLATEILSPGHVSLTPLGADPLALTKAEGLAIIERFQRSCGVTPKRRFPGVGRVEACIAHAIARLNDASGQGGARNTVAEYGGWPNIPVVVDVTNIEAMFPSVAAGRDVPYTSGTLSNGASRVGLTKAEVVALEMHYARGGM